MNRKQLTTGIAVAIALVVVGFFFTVFNPLMLMQQQPQDISLGDLSNEGFVVQDEIVGTGSTVGVGDTITVNYVGKLQDGSVFDSSIGKQPYQFTLGVGEVIPGWDQGLQGMKIGGKRLLIVPPSLAYGSQGFGPIPPNATLIFEVQLLSVEESSAVPEME